MRIIAGSARGRAIQAPEGRDTRPTLDRVRENLFNVLARRVMDARVLDLFAGSGALALESLSRGASSAVMVDHDRAAIRCVRANVESLRFGPRARVMQADWQAALATLAAEGARFDLVFLDPPYAMADLSPVTASLWPLLSPEGLVVIEHRAKSEPLISPGFVRTDDRRWGIAGVTMYAPMAEEEG